MTDRFNQRRTKEEVTVSLFPFLAVLLCTMGMLVMLLVLISQGTQSLKGDAGVNSAKKEEAVAKESVDKKDPEDQRVRLAYEEWQKRFNGASIEELQNENESASWFLSELKTISDRTDEALRKERDRLAAAERGTLERIKEIKRLQEGIRLLQTEEKTTLDEKSLRALLQTDQERIKELQTSIEKEKESKKMARPKYAIVPYQGKAGTIRYPIYIECNASGIFLMPEGIPFAVEDFLLAKYPGNPFDMAIRTARQYIMEHADNSKESLKMEPYPLLIVRPGGSDKYYTAISALSSWGGEYGYELVDEDWELDYPPGDPELNWRVKEQISLARAKLAIPLAAIVARLERGEGSGPFQSTNTRASNGTGDQRSSSALQGQLGSQVRLGKIREMPGSGLSSPMGPVASGDGSITTSRGDLRAGLGSFSGRGGENGSLAAPNYSSVASAYASQSEVVGSSGKSAGLSNAIHGGGESGPGSDPSSLPQYQGRWSNPSGQNEKSSSSNGASSALASKSEIGSYPSGSVTGDPMSLSGDPSIENPSDPLLAMIQQSERIDSNGSTSAKKSDGSSWETVGNTTYAQGAQGSQRSGSLAPGSANDDSASVSGMPTAMIEKEKIKKEESKVDPNAGYASTKKERKAISLSELVRQPTNAAIERAIRIECYPDRIVFPKQNGLRQEQSISLETGDANWNQTFYQTIALCVNGWGVAGRNMYWTPWLQIKIHPGGEPFFSRIQKIGEAEGITVKGTR